MSNNKLQDNKEIARRKLLECKNKTNFTNKTFLLNHTYIPNVVLEEAYTCMPNRFFSIIPLLYLASDKEGKVWNLTISRMAKTLHINERTLSDALNDIFDGIKEKDPFKRQARMDYLKKFGIERKCKLLNDGRRVYSYSIARNVCRSEGTLFRRSLLSKWEKLKPVSHLYYFYNRNVSKQDIYYPNGIMCDEEATTNNDKRTHEIVPIKFKPFSVAKKLNISKSTIQRSIKELSDNEILVDHPINDVLDKTEILEFYESAKNPMMIFLGEY